MTGRETGDIAARRLLSHRLAGTPFTSIAAVVGWLGAIQSQEYAVAKWSVGQRSTGIGDAAMDRALADGTVLRTHILRPTWHFVAAADIRWLLALTAPRVHAVNAYYYRRLGLDEAVLARSNALLARTLAGGNQLTRKELAAALVAGGIEADALRLGYVLMYAELEAVIVSGGLNGKQRTYALFDERVPPTEPWERDRALAELTRRYFTSHGPATRADFQWWSSLTAADAKRGLALAAADLAELEVDGQTYWYAAEPSPGRLDPSPTVHLLQGYDEYVVAYAGRPRAFDVADFAGSTPYGRPPFMHAIILDGQYVGSWQRTLAAGQMSVQVRLARQLDAAERAALADAVDRYGRFVDLPATLAAEPAA
jgi:winged helix DNA-binding protein